jgi:hypothetical protein
METIANGLEERIPSDVALPGIRDSDMFIEPNKGGGEW